MTGVIDTLDDWGRPAWITVMVLGFILYWPIGLGILAYLIWSGRMTCGTRGDMRRWRGRMARRWDDKMDRWAAHAHAHRSSGNRAFDEYREETLRRLEDEEREFRAFLDKLRMAKDRAEFDQFMTDRRAKPAGGPEPSPAA